MDQQTLRSYLIKKDYERTGTSIAVFAAGLMGNSLLFSALPFYNSALVTSFICIILSSLAWGYNIFYLKGHLNWGRFSIILAGLSWTSLFFVSTYYLSDHQELLYIITLYIYATITFWTVVFKYDRAIVTIQLTMALLNLIYLHNYLFSTPGLNQVFLIGSFIYVLFIYINYLYGYKDVKNQISHLNLKHEYSLEVQRNIQKQHDINLQNQKIALKNLSLGLSHEINNPLSIIKANSQNYLKKLNQIDHAELSSTDTKESLITMLNKINSQTDRIAYITNLISKLSEEEFISENQTLKIIEIINPIKNELEAKYSVSIELILDPVEAFNKPLDLPKEILHLVFFTLFENSVQAISQSLTVTSPLNIKIYLSSTHNGDFLNISIYDLGPGVDPSLIPNLFTPFSTTKTHIGAGINLYLAKKYLATIQGDLTFENKISPSHFNVRIPVKGVI